MRYIIDMEQLMGMEVVNAIIDANEAARNAQKKLWLVRASAVDTNGSLLLPSALWYVRSAKAPIGIRQGARRRSCERFGQPKPT
jgi:hypothetical protein